LASFEQFPDRNAFGGLAYREQKQRILWERYGLRWPSPADLKPGMEFD